MLLEASVVVLIVVLHDMTSSPSSLVLLHCSGSAAVLLHCSGSAAVLLHCSGSAAVLLHCSGSAAGFLFGHLVDWSK